MEKIEQKNIESIKKGVNDVSKKCIRIPIPKTIFNKGEYLELDYDAFMQAKMEFPGVEFLNPMKREIEEKGEYVEFLYHYK